VADQVREIVHALAKKTPAALFFECDAVELSGCALLSLQGGKDNTSGKPRFEVDTIETCRHRHTPCSTATAPPNSGTREP
jgi:hypothetical protein